MSENREIQCEYSTTRSNENKCKALELEFHNCLNILEQKKCPIYKLKQQLQAKEQECEELKDEILSLRKDGKKSCSYCADFIEKEKENKMLQQEIKKLKQEEMKLIDESIKQKCKIRKLVDENATKEVIYKINGKCAKTVANKVKEIRKIVEGKDCKWSKYKQALDVIEEFCTVYSNNHDAYETVYKHILNIISEVMDGE